MITIVHCHNSLVEQTVSILKDAGRTRQECLVLWLAEKNSSGIEVREVMRPLQIAGRDFFRIPPHSMKSIMQRLKENSLIISAQIHTHPFEAFHSRADDRWAIVRHVGALSFVVPFFAHSTNTENFLQNAALFVLDVDNRWVRKSPYLASQLCQIYS